jgi:hypothetical protein
MATVLLAVALDCIDMSALERFWTAALGTNVVTRWTDSLGKTYVEIGLPSSGGSAVLLLQPVDAPTEGKNRMHLDLAPTDSDQDGEVARLVALGATRLADEARYPWVVMADPEGNEFCVLPPRRS